MEFVQGQKLSTTSPTVYLTRMAARQLRDHCAGPTLRDARDRMLLTVMLRTGVRSSEALGLTVADLATGTAIRWRGSRAKAARARVKLPPDVARQVRQYLADAAITSGSVFPRLRPIGPRQPADGSPRQYRASGPLSYSGLYFILTRRFEDADLDS